MSVLIERLVMGAISKNTWERWKQENWREVQN